MDVLIGLCCTALIINGYLTWQCVDAQEKKIKNLQNRLKEKENNK